MALTEVFTTLAAGVVFGLALAAPPGPMNAVIAEESVVQGWVAGFTAGLGAMVADACFLVLALVGAVTFVQRFPLVRGLMILAGGLLMLWFAYGAVEDVREQFSTDGGTTGDATAESTDAGASKPTRGFRKAFLLAITNPYQIAFWLTVGIGLLEPGTVDVLGKTPYVGASLAGTVVVRTGSPALLAGLFGGIVIWIVSFPAGLIAAGRRVDRLAPAIAYGSAVVLAGFGVYFLYDATTTLVDPVTQLVASLL
jgi:threonine/homoserine/homoserine lactone efflux protein